MGAAVAVSKGQPQLWSLAFCFAYTILSIMLLPPIWRHIATEEEEDEKEEEALKVKIDLARTILLRVLLLLMLFENLSFIDTYVVCNVPRPLSIF